MGESQAIAVDGLSKRFSSTFSVRDVGFCVARGSVTGFLGPNGAGKSSVIRLILGLERCSGRALLDGTSYVDLSNPARRVGVMLDRLPAHPRHSVVGHLRMIAAGIGVQNGRIDEVLGIVGLSDVASRKIRALSLGMAQRLAIATSILGDPKILILDEPANGLDPSGLIWFKSFLRGYVKEGGSVLASSHNLADVSVIADDLVVMSKGRVTAAASVVDFVEKFSHSYVQVRTDEPDRLALLLQSRGGRVVTRHRNRVHFDGLSAYEVAKLALEWGILIYELQDFAGSLEDAYFAFAEVPRDDVTFRSLTLSVTAKRRAVA